MVFLIFLKKPLSMTKWLNLVFNFGKTIVGIGDLGIVS